MGFPTFFPPHASRFSSTRRSLIATSGAVGGAPGITDPSDISDLTGWWDAEDNTTIVDVGGFATRWNSKAPAPALAKDFQNLLGGQAPAIVTVSSHQMLNFDGSNDWLADIQSNDALQPGSGSFTVWAISRGPIGGNSSGVQIWQQDGGGATPTWSLRAVPNLARFTCRDGPTSLLVSSIDEDFSDGSNRYFILGTRDNAAAEIQLYFGGDGLDLAETSMGGTAIPGGFGSVDAVNSALGNFPMNTAGFYWDGDFGEWGFYKKALSSSERFQLYNYIRNKWGLTVP